MSSSDKETLITLPPDVMLYQTLTDETSHCDSSLNESSIAKPTPFSAEKIAFTTMLITLPNFWAIQLFPVAIDESINIRVLKAINSSFYNAGIGYYFGAEGNKRFAILLKKWWGEKEENCLESWLKLIGGSSAVIYLAIGANAMFLTCPQSFPASTSFMRQLRDGYGWSNLITFIPMHLGGAMEALEALRGLTNKLLHYCSAFRFSKFEIWKKKEKQAYVLQELNYLLKQIIQKYKVDPKFRNEFEKTQLKIVEDQLLSNEDKLSFQLRRILTIPLGDSLYENKVYNYLKRSLDIIIYDFLWLPASILIWFVMAYTQFGYWIGAVETNSVLGWNTVIINLFLMLMETKIYFKLFFCYPSDLLLGFAAGHFVKPFAYYNDTWRGNIFFTMKSILLGLGGYYSGYNPKNLINAYLYNPNGNPQLINSRFYWPQLILIGAALFNCLPVFQILFNMIGNKHQVEVWLKYRISRRPDFKDVKQSARNINCGVKGLWSVVSTTWNFFSFLTTDILLILPDKICMWILLKFFLGFCALIPKASDQHQNYVFQLDELAILEDWVEKTSINSSPSVKKIVNTIGNLLDNNTGDEIYSQTNKQTSILSAAIQRGLFSELTLSQPACKKKEVMDDDLMGSLNPGNMFETGHDDKIEEVLKKEFKKFNSDEKNLTDLTKKPVEYFTFAIEQLSTTWGPFVVGLVVNKAKNSSFLSTSVLSGATRLLWTIGHCMTKFTVPTSRQIYRDLAPGAVGFLTSQVVRLGLEQINSMENSPYLDTVATQAGMISTTITASFLKRLP